MKVLILGGYGVFGGRLARLLLKDGVEAVVAGRDSAKAAAFTKVYGGTPLCIEIGRISRPSQRLGRMPSWMPPVLSNPMVAIPIA